MAQMAGIFSTNMDPTAVSDEIIVNRDGSTMRQKTADLATQLAGSGPIATQLAAAGAGIKAYPLLVNLNADLAPANGVVAWVTEDPAPANNGKYRKNGAANAGDWVRFADLDDTAIATEVVDARGGKANLDTRLSEVDGRSQNAADRLNSILSIPGLAAAGPVLVFIDAKTGAVVSWFDRDGYLNAELKQGGKAMPVSAIGIYPKWGYMVDGRFAGFDAEDNVIGRIDRALAEVNRVPDPHGYGLDVNFSITGPEGRAVLSQRRGGGLIDHERAYAPLVGTEWLMPNGDRVAPLTAGAYECVVAYFRTGERRVLTSPTLGQHFSAPEIAYGGISVRCWRRSAIPTVGQPVAVSIEYPDFIVPDDPKKLYVIGSDGQSLGQGSGAGNTTFPITRVPWPDHTLTFRSTVLPGDIRGGRDATSLASVLNGSTLTDFMPLTPRVGVSAAHGFTPVEGLVIALQDEIVAKIGRPQRLLAFANGVGGASITSIGVDTQNEANMVTFLTRAAEIAASKGWDIEFLSFRLAHGETDAAMDASTYAAAVTDYRNSVDATAMGLSGQDYAPIWLLAQPSSFAETIDDEATKLSIIGMVEMAAARPADTVLTTPGYAHQESYVQTDFMHFIGHGYFDQGEADAGILRHMAWGGLRDMPLTALSAEIADAVITVTWSETVEQNPDLMAYPNLGVEVSLGTDTFLTIASHMLVDNTSVITLTAPVAPGDIPNLRVHIGLTGQTYPTRTAAAVPGTNIRTVRKPYRASRLGLVKGRVAPHQRLPVSPA